MEDLAAVVEALNSLLSQVDDSNITIARKRAIIQSAKTVAEGNELVRQKLIELWSHPVLGATAFNTWAMAVSGSRTITTWAEVAKVHAATIISPLQKLLSHPDAEIQISLLKEMVALLIEMHQNSHVSDAEKALVAISLSSGPGQLMALEYVVSDGKLNSNRSYYVDLFKALTEYFKTSTVLKKDEAKTKLFICMLKIYLTHQFPGAIALYLELIQSEIFEMMSYELQQDVLALVS